MVIPNISCACGRTIQAWRQVKKGLTKVVCRCGRVWTLVKAGEPILISQEGQNYKAMVEKEAKLGCEYGTYSDGEDRVFNPEVRQ